MNASRRPPRSIDTPIYHLWTDALHARSLARETTNQWDLGSYVRWAIISAWTAFESACGEALQEPHLGYRFKENFNTAMERLGLPTVHWDRDVWQRVLEIQQLRIDYVHRHLPQERLFPSVEEADAAIKNLREAMRELHSRLGNPTPTWIEADSAQGWSGRQHGLTATVSVVVTRVGANEADPEVIRVKYVYQDKETLSEVLPPGTDPEQAMNSLLENIVIPITAVRAYRGDTLIREIKPRNWRY